LRSLELDLGFRGCAQRRRPAATVGPVNPGVSGFLPPDEYIASLARNRMAACALFRDEDGRVLLVDPVYRETWDLPGGAVEADESPQAGCCREVAEELGLDRPAGRVLAVDWVPSRPERPEGLVVVYDGGILSPAEIAAITVPASELAGFAFIPPGEVAGRVTPLVGRRIFACLEAADRGLVLSLEAGRPS
jgi:8-oxo-dGTP diphosphatase